MDRLSILQLSLHGSVVGHLAGYSHGKNILLFDDEFRRNPERPTLSLITHPDFPKAETLLANDWSRHQRLHPLLSNLLPEGALRELLAHSLKTHIDYEFSLLAWPGLDLPGALIARPLSPDNIPAKVLARLPHARTETIEYPPVLASGNKFSLAGVQMKFSMKEKDGRYNLIHSAVDDRSAELGEWIIKTPSTQHAYVPLNEFSAMQLASLAGIDMPETRLVALNKLDNLPAIRLPEESMAFAIKRFDRQRGLQGTERVHMEDFAQVLAKYPHEKYGSANYEQIGRILYQFSGDAIADAQQFARRLLVNILLANGDAHLKNWSLLYSDRYTPRLSPAYDIVTTSVYMDNERTTALNMAGQKVWYQTSMESFQHWAKKADIPWRLIKLHLDDTLDKARNLWPQALTELPMHEPHKQALRAHWQRLHTDFRLPSG